MAPTHDASILDALDSPIALVANDWRIVKFNNAWARALGIGSAHLQGVSLWTACPLLARAPAPEMLRATAGDGAGVITAFGADAQVVVAVGAFEPAHGKRFSLAGSLAEEAIRSQGTVALDDFGGSARPLTRAAPALDIGPVLLAPLIAHENV